MYRLTIVNSHSRLLIIIFFVNQTAMGAEKELEKWRQQIQELQDRCQAALHVMEEFRGMSTVAPNLNDYDLK